MPRPDSQGGLVLHDDNVFHDQVGFTSADIEAFEVDGDVYSVTDLQTFPAENDDQGVLRDVLEVARAEDVVDVEGGHGTNRF